MDRFLPDGLRGFGLAAVALGLAGCVHVAQPAASSSRVAVLCETDAVAISTGFSGAGQHGCAISADGPVLTVWPEASLAGPINPSPWYAFEADIHSSDPVEIGLDYAGYWHRYAPWISDDDGETWQRLPDEAVSVGPEGHLATITLPGGPETLIVAGEPNRTPADQAAWSRSLADRHDMNLVTFGKSLDGRALMALTAGSPEASRIVVAITGQHPPEWSGVSAFDAFAETLMSKLPQAERARTRFVLLPMVNPDGRARGHWRHNNGGLDLNRDWFNQTQPETREAAAFIAAQAEGRKAVAFMDFHSTHETLVYTPPFEENLADMSFPQALKDALDAAVDPDPEWISGHNADSGTSKTWALQTLNVAGLTIELADDASEEEISKVGQLAANTVLEFLSRPEAASASRTD